MSSAFTHQGMNPLSTSPAAASDDERPRRRAGRETVSLVIPLYNEEEVIDILIGELETFRKSRPEVTEVVLVDDGSRDRTVESVRRRTELLSGYTLVSLSRNFGHQIAVTAGLEFVRTDAAIIMDADLQDPLEVAERMIDRWREGYDVVYGVRSEREGEGFMKKATAKMFYRFFRWITELDMPLDTGDFRLVSRDVIDAYSRIGEQDPFVRGLISWLGFNQVGVTYERHARVAGSTKYPWRRMMDLAFKA
ncbi:MAG: glycosyltransferase family 2 protein, partial [Rhodothermales bacterium]|nr:glycosyltransferase family 2 protein [Rhodothermales bacterium]